MPATITKGQTFSSTEQITNTKLHNLVDLATISGIVPSEFSTSILSSLLSAAGKIPTQNLWSITTVATNASVPDVTAGTHFKLYASTYMTIASFSNYRTPQEFTIIAYQASFPSILDTGSFLLNGNWIPAKSGDNITLFWDGSNFVELRRTAV